MFEQNKRVFFESERTKASQKRTKQVRAKTRGSFYTASVEGGRMLAVRRMSRKGGLLPSGADALVGRLASRAVIRCPRPTRYRRDPTVRLSGFREGRTASRGSLQTLLWFLMGCAARAARPSFAMRYSAMPTPANESDVPPVRRQLGDGGKGAVPRGLPLGFGFFPPRSRDPFLR
jgi:hypothetical protein